MLRGFPKKNNDTRVLFHIALPLESCLLQRDRLSWFPVFLRLFLWQQKNLNKHRLFGSIRLQHRFIEASEFSHLPYVGILTFHWTPLRHFLQHFFWKFFVESSDLPGLAMVSLDIKIILGPEFVSNACSVALSNISFPWEQLKMAVAVEGEEGHILGRHEHH